MDVRPLTPGHLLVVPRVHAASLEVLDEDLGTRVFAVAHRLARALRNSAVPCEGVNFFLADGVPAGQEVFHVHLHVIPRTPGDGFRLKARRRTPGRDELDATAERVRSGMSSLPGDARIRNLPQNAQSYSWVGYWPRRLVAIGYLISLHPFTRSPACPACKGLGTPGLPHGSIYGYTHRRCRRCGGTNRQERLGTRLGLGGRRERLPGRGRGGR